MNKSHSLATHLVVMTSLLVLVLVSVFAVLAHSAFEHQREASRILSVINSKRDLLSAQEAMRLETTEISPALDESEPENAETINEILRLHRQSQRAFADLQKHDSSEYSAGFADVLKRRADFNAIFPATLEAVKKPAAYRTKAFHDSWSLIVTRFFLVSTDESISLTHQVSSADIFINQMLQINDIAWYARTDTGIDLHTLSQALLARPLLNMQTLQHLNELAGRLTSAWRLLRDDAGAADFPQSLKNNIARAHARYLGNFQVLRQGVIQNLIDGKPVPMTNAQWVSLSNQSAGDIAAISNAALDLSTAHAQQRFAASNRNLAIALAFMLMSIALACFAMLHVLWRLIRPLKTITRTMEAIAAGDLAADIPFGARKDEIGQFAQALEIFRQGAVEKRRLEYELMQNQVARQAAETSNRVKSEFLANMSHELRTPLNAIIGFSDVMQHKMFGPLSERYDEYARLINESGNHLLNLVSDILDLAKIEAGKFSVDFHDVDIGEIVTSCLRLMQRSADACGVTLTHALPAEPVALVADPRACKQILLNLLSNAVKFTRGGGVVDVTVTADAQHLTLIVGDSGIGIPAEALSRIGSAFEQASNDPLRAREGTGLGLALVRALVGQHGGALCIESQEHVGTTVTVQLPLTQASRAAA